MKNKKIDIKQEVIGLTIGGLTGYVIGIIYMYIFSFIFIRIGALSFLPKISDFLTLKDPIIRFNQIISTAFGLLIGYYKIKNRKTSIIFLIGLLLYYFIFIVLWLFFVTMVGPLFG